MIFRKYLDTYNQWWIVFTSYIILHAANQRMLNLDGDISNYINIEIDRAIEGKITRMNYDRTVQELMKYGFLYCVNNYRFNGYLISQH